MAAKLTQFDLFRCFSRKCKSQKVLGNGINYPNFRADSIVGFRKMLAGLILHCIRHFCSPKAKGRELF